MRAGILTVQYPCAHTFISFTMAMTLLQGPMYYKRQFTCLDQMSDSKIIYIFVKTSDIITAGNKNTST